MLAFEVNLQKQLFGPTVNFLDDDGFLSREAISEFKQIGKVLKAKGTSLEVITEISEGTWNNWLYRRRPPSGAALAFLKVFMAHPEMVLETLQVLEKNNVSNLAQ